MELFDLEYGLSSVASGGNTLNCQEILLIQAGLNVLKCKENYKEIYFWGKITGQTSDYYIAYGLSEADFEFPSKIFHYARDDCEFKAMPRLTEEIAERVLELDVRAVFKGDPALLIEPGAVADEEGGGDEEAEAAAAADANKPQKLTELDRLALVTQEIDFDTSAVPKGAHALNESHTVVQSNDFKGLGLTEATDLKKYVHFRAPTSVAALRALARSDVQFYADFLDPLEGDLPKGCWAVRQDPSVSLVTLRSLCWPGYIGYHIPGTKQFGGLYFGYGQKNRDLPFIL
jgi:radial spoke head protein 9